MPNRVSLPKELLEGFLRLLFPANCEVCGAELPQRQKIGLCPACWRQIELIRHPYCERCGKLLPDGIEELCLDCRVEPFPVETRGAAVYHGAIVPLVHLFKYSFWPSLADQLSGLIIERLHALFPAWQPEALIPVPLHKRRLRWRGFNQSLLLAKRLSPVWRVPVVEPLKRTRNTLPQVRLEPEARLVNIAGAFTITDIEAIRGKRLCLLDDVSTTGSTLGECARVLLEAGAAEVRALVLALPRSPEAELL